MASNNGQTSLEGHKLLILSPYPTRIEDVESVKSKFPSLDIVVRQQPFELADPYAEVDEQEWIDVTVVMTGSALPPLHAAPKLQLVQLCNAGINHVAHQPFFKETEIPFCTAGGVAGPQIAEWVVSTFLAFHHNLPQYLEFQRDEHWEKLAEEKHEDAVGRTVGILGYGAIGRQIARVAKSLGMNVHAYTHHPRNTPASRRDTSYVPPGLGDPDGKLPDRWLSGSLHDFLSSGLDLLVIALPLTDKTRHLIGKAEFALMAERRTFVCNIARGPIIRTDDLIEALKKGVIRGAALDVTDPEPLPKGHPLWKAKNVIVTPHCAGTSMSYSQRLIKVLETNLERLARNQEFVNRVNKKDGY